MSLSLLLASWGAALVTSVALDVFWLGVVARTFYRSRIGHLMADSTSWTPAVLFYLLYAAAIIGFVVAPSVGHPLWRVALRGAALGVVAYGTYDLVNQATLRNWPWQLTLADMAWGALLTAAAATVAALAWRALA